MSNKMAHERLSAKKRVISSELRTREAKKNPDLIYVEFGKHLGKNIRLPELVLTNPGYFYWALSNGAFRQFNPWLQSQAEQIAEKAKHIMPPRARPNDWAFDIELRDNHILDFEIVKKGAPPTKGNVLRIKHLDLSLLSLQTKEICEKLAIRIREEFFPDRDLTHWDYQDFFETSRNFDISCRETHCPKIGRRVAEPRACRRYDGTDEE